MKKILIVDDDPMMLKLVSRTLMDKYAVSCASSGAEAVDMILDDLPDLVLSDLRMPGMTGYELFDVIKQKGISDIPFVFMTADESDESESKGFDKGAADYIRKPIKSALLHKRIERIFQNVDEAVRLREAAETDMMTGLLNKAAVNEAISKVCKDSVGVLFIFDLDDFKLVNDLYGHEMGDKVLIRFAELIKSITRTGDIVGRMGGDEFIAFCHNLQNEAVIRKKVIYLNDEIVKSCKEFMGEDMNIPIGCSVGAALVNADGKDFNDLFKRADAAMYFTKQGSKHGYNIFKEDDRIQGESDVSNSFQSIRKIFGERNIGMGAWVADKEQFAAVYKFLNRFLHNYPWDIRILSFVLSAEDETDIERYTDRFIDIAKQIMRTSDIILKYNKNCVLMMLMKVDNVSIDVPVSRVIDAWNKECDRDIEILYESVSLDGKEKETDE